MGRVSGEVIVLHWLDVRRAVLGGEFRAALSVCTVTALRRVSVRQSQTLTRA